METVVQVAGLCLAASVTASLLRHSSPELGVVLALAAALLGGALLLRGADARGVGAAQGLRRRGAGTRREGAADDVGLPRYESIFDCALALRKSARYIQG